VAGLQFSTEPADAGMNNRSSRTLEDQRESGRCLPARHNAV